MSWQERDWARDKAPDREEKRPDRPMEGAFPSPVRPDAAYDTDSGDEKRAARFASWMELVDTVRGKVGAFLSNCTVRNFQEAAAATEILHKLVIASHNAQHLDNGEVEEGGDDGDDEE